MKMFLNTMASVITKTLHRAVGTVMGLGTVVSLFALLVIILALFISLGAVIAVIILTVFIVASVVGGTLSCFKSFVRLFDSNYMRDKTKNGTVKIYDVADGLHHIASKHIN